MVSSPITPVLNLIETPLFDLLVFEIYFSLISNQRTSLKKVFSFRLFFRLGAGADEFQQQIAADPQAPG
jgi:hypothetical protein